MKCSFDLFVLLHLQSEACITEIRILAIVLKNPELTRVDFKPKDYLFHISVLVIV
jgi:hypothetical protein